MCGIVGMSWKDEKRIRRMSSLIAHRGPDDSGIFSDDAVTLGHRRLSIIDVSERGHQPMIDENGYAIVFNGEIYNYQEIKDELTDYHFRTGSDTEVVLAAYQAWGASCVERFNGMWALCLYDPHERRLFLSRDRFGKKPLYYTMDEGLVFSSELKALMEVEGCDIDQEAFNETMTYRFAFGERTICKGIQSFLPGHSMLYDLSEKRITSYGPYYTVRIRHYKGSFEQAKRRTYSLVQDAVAKRMVADVPVGAFLSGGIDSSIVCHCARKHNPDLNTFSIGFDTTNELSFAKLMAERLGTRHHEFVIDKDSVLEHLDDMVYHMDEPIGADPGFLPIFVLSKEVRKHNKVVLSGDGADEIFLGYDRYKLFHYGRWLRHFALFDGGNEILKRLRAMRSRDDFSAFLAITRVFEPRELERMGVAEAYDRRAWDVGGTVMQRMQHFDIMNLLPRDFFMKADKMSSAFGLEQRCPYMDYRLVEFALSLPRRFKLRGWNEKHVLKEAFRGEMPREIWERRKHGFNVPIDYWFEHSLGERLRGLVGKKNHKLYNTDFALELLEELRTAEGGFKARNIIAQKLWTLLVFEMWYERFVM